MNSKTGDWRRAEQVGKQDRAVDVAPLEVVDRQDQRRSAPPAVSSSSRSPAKARRRSSCWSGISVASRRAAGDRLHALQDRKHPGQEAPRPRAAGSRPPGPAAPSSTAPGRRSGCRAPCRGPIPARSSARPARRPRPCDQLVEERSNQGGLAGPRPAEDEDRLGLAPVERGEQAVEDLAMPRPPDQGKRAVRLGHVDRAGHAAAQLRDHGTAGRPLRRISVEERDAEAHQILRQALDQRSRRRGGIASAWRRSPRRAGRTNGSRPVMAS